MINCASQKPNASCPDGYNVPELRTTALNSDTAYDTYKTCVRDEIDDAMLCVATFSNTGSQYSLFMDGTEGLNGTL